MAANAPQNDLPPPPEFVPDPMLRLLVQSANAHGLELPLTVHVHGALITGVLTSAETFWKKTGSFLRSMTDAGEAGEALAGMMDSAASTQRDAWGSHADGGDLPIPRFIHLRDARTVTQAGLAPVGGIAWRGYLESVDGFSVGTLSAPQP